MKPAKAFAPGNISCIFKIYNHKNPRWAGSYGLGFTVNEGVIVTAEISAGAGIFFNGKKINFPTVQGVIDTLTKNKKVQPASLKITIVSKLPLGCGFGLSGASALGAAYALNKLLNLKKSKKALAIIAHTAEVKNKTGLGDVVNQYYGGCCLKLQPSSHFIVTRLPISKTTVYCKYFSSLDTKSVITNPALKKSINTAATKTLRRIQRVIKNNKKIKFSEIIKIAKEFAIMSNLLQDKRTTGAIKNIEKNNGNGSMIMLGNAVFSDIPFNGSMKLRIANTGACVL